jgi:glutathione S-transferase
MPKLMFNIEPPEEKLKTFQNALKLLDIFIGDNKYVAGNHLTIADLSILSLAVVLKTIDYDLSEYAYFAKWLDRLQTELSYFDQIHGIILNEPPDFYVQMRDNLKLLNNASKK